MSERCFKLSMMHFGEEVLFGEDSIHQDKIHCKRVAEN